MRRLLILMCFVWPSISWADCNKMVEGYTKGLEMLLSQVPPEKSGQIQQELNQIQQWRETLSACEVKARIPKLAESERALEEAVRSINRPK